MYTIPKKTVNENGLEKKSGTTTPYTKSRISPPIIISYPGETAINKKAKKTVAYHGNRNMLRKNKDAKKARLIIVIEL